MGPKKGVTVTEALTRNLAPLLEMKVNQDGIPTALEPGGILSFLHEMEQYNAQRTDVMERALILSCMSGDVRNYLAQYESLTTVNHTENDEEQEWEPVWRPKFSGKLRNFKARPPGWGAAEARRAEAVVAKRLAQRFVSGVWSGRMY